jgi:ADP-heptose:LPS heptosyltransferase
LEEDGKAKTRQCAGCGGNVRLKLFPCSHPALEPQEVTIPDCRSCRWRPLDRARQEWLILKNHLSPGDVTVMTAAVHCLQQAHPGAYAIAVDTTCPAVWEHNPDVVSLEEAHAHGATVVQTNCNQIQESNQRPIHFMQAYCTFLEEYLQKPVPLVVNRPLVYLSRREKSWQNQVEEHKGYRGKFWLVNAGVKGDFTNKQYPFYQHLVDSLQGKIVLVQVGKAEHRHEPLKGVIDLVGQTDDRQLIRLVHHAQGVLCSTTWLMHLAAALERPAVVIAGGREPRSWNSYVRQTLLSSVGSLDCCREAACWRSRTVPLGDGDKKDESLCENPVFTDPPSPKCMALFGPEEVAAAIMRYQ